MTCLNEPTGYQFNKLSTDKPTCIVIRSVLSLAAAAASFGWGDTSNTSDPLYQNTVPKSCGPCLIMHVNVIELPAFTCRSLGPKMRALASETKNCFNGPRADGNK